MAIKNSPVIGITGGHGFIGGHLTKYLQQEGVPFVLFEGDLLKEEDVRSFFERNKVATVIHLVGTMEEPFGKLLSTNAITTQSLLKVGTDSSLRKIIFASTGAVYGAKENILSKETDALHPTSLYGLSKLFAEEVCSFYEREIGLQTIILRFSNVYGKGNSKNVIGRMVRDIQTKRKVFIAGDGEQRRQFLHVDDAVKAIILSLQLNSSEILNIANKSNDYSINELVTLLKKYFNFEITHIPTNNNLKNLLLEGDKAKEKIGFTPLFQLENFFKEII